MTGSNTTLIRIPVFFCLLIQLVYAGTTGKLVGKVTDKSTGEPLIGANVLLNGTVMGAATGLDGRYFILQIPPGSFDVRFTMIGFQDVIIHDIRIRVDLTTTINAELEEGVIGLEAVDVTANRPMIQADVTYSQANVSSDEINMLPVEEFEDVIALQAGVVVSDGNMHVRGGRTGEIAFMIDGVTVTDPFNAGMAVDIENNAIQELQFISGTFNAEYGQAMSGIINIITKDGDYNKYSGNVSINGGSYFTRGRIMEVDLLNSNNDLVVDSSMNLFPHLGKFEPGTIKDIQASINGPIIPGKISFFGSGRYKWDGGYLFGQRLFVPESHVWNPVTNNYDFMTAADTSYWESIGAEPSDSALVRMEWTEQYSGQMKLSWRISPVLKIAYNFIGSETAYQEFSQTYKWNPDGVAHQFQTKSSHILRLDFSLNSSTYINAMISRSANNNRSYLSDDPNYKLKMEKYNVETPFGEFTIYGLDTSLYNVDPAVDSYTPEYNYEVGGEDMDYENRKSIVDSYKFEAVSQLNRFHYVKGGFEYRKTNISFTDLTVLLAAFTNGLPIVPDAQDSPEHDTYGKKGRNPVEYAFYLQDKIEFDDLIVNIGARWDYFDPKWKTVNDLSDPNINQPVKPINNFFDLDGDGTISEDEILFGFMNDSMKTVEDRLISNANREPWYNTVKSTQQISPRFALAFPITDQGFLHFSYGHFFQTPNFSFLYSNPEFEIPPGSGTEYTMGNAEMKPQRTTQYEVGFSQQIGNDYGIEVTGYFKDIRNLNSTKIIQSFVAGDLYGLYINRDHANSKGITLAISKRPTSNISGNIDYTFSVSEGNASDPGAAFLDEQSNVEPEKMLVPLDWDQRHTLNATITYHPVENSGISIIYNFGSGLPYTAEFAGMRTSFENNARKPSTMNVDMRSYYNFTVFSLDFSLHLNVYNLLDNRNELEVFSETGRSTYSLLPTYTPQVSGPGYNTLDQYLVRPDYFSSPREIKFGFSIAF